MPTSAQSILVAKKLNVKLDQAYSTTVPTGDVISQDPKAGSVVPINSTVKLVVSLGAKTFPMPYVVGESSSSAQSQLEALGLRVHVVRIPASAGDTVVGQDPPVDITIKQGDTVTIYVA